MPKKGAFSIGNPSTNQTVSIDATNINNKDVWLYKLNSSGIEDELWTKVDAVEGNNIISIQVHNASIGGSSDFFFDAELTAIEGPTNRGPTPGSINSIYNEELLPRLTKIEHSPKQPKSGEPVIITSKPSFVPNGAKLLVNYQVVQPGNYIQIDEDAYEQNWNIIPMNDLGQAGDKKAMEDLS